MPLALHMTCFLLYNFLLNLTILIKLLVESIDKRLTATLFSDGFIGKSEEQ